MASSVSSHSKPVRDGRPNLMSKPERITSKRKGWLLRTRHLGEVLTPDSGETATKVLRSEKEIRMAEGFNWPVVGWLVVLHVGALAAPFVFTWQGLVAAIVLHWLTGGIGVCLGCAVAARSKPYRYVCTDGPVFDVKDLA